MTGQQWGQQERPKMAPAPPSPASGGRSNADADRIAELEMRIKAAEADLVTLDLRCKRQGEAINALAQQLADLAARARRAY